MENIIVNKYMQMIEPLAFEVKLELLAKLTESLKKSHVSKKVDKEQMMANLFGAWSDIDTDHLVQEIYSSRTHSDKNINFD